MLQIVEQTKEEKMAMYMKLPKKEIAEMLINCNDNLTALTQTQHCVMPDVSGSASSEPNLIAQPQMWVDWYQIVYGGNEQEAKRAWGRKMYLLGY